MDVLLWLGVFVLLAYTVEAMTGFGSIVIALSLGALLMPVAELVPILVPLNVLMTSWLCWRLRRHLDLALLRTRILPWMLAGTVVGYLTLPLLREDWLKPLFGALVVWFAAREWWRLRGGSLQGASGRRVRPFIFAAGISHGLFASGGPLLVYALAGTPLDKARLRATLICVWLVLNSGLTLAFLVDGRLAVALPSLLWLAPLLPLGVWLGEHLHQRVDEQQFRQWLYAVLLLVGALLVVNSLPVLYSA